MRIAVAGERFGHLFSLYKELEDKNIDWLIQVGSLGAYADKLRWTKAMRRGDTPDDFQKIYSGQFDVPVRTIFTEGKHDDNVWLDYRAQMDELEIAYNLTLAVNGYKVFLGENDDTLSLVALGKTFSPKIWKGGRKSPKDNEHYTRREIERACSHGPVDLFVAHEPPFGVKCSTRKSKAEGLQKVVFATQPKLMVHKSYDANTTEYQLLNTKCIALAPYAIKYFEFKDNQFSEL